MERRRALMGVLASLALLFTGIGVAVASPAVVPSTIQPARAATTPSQFNPPPLCSSPHTGSCVAQPSPSWDGIFKTPVLIDFPTMVRDFRDDGPSHITGRVTFTMTSAGTTNAGDPVEPLGFKYPYFFAIPIDGYSDPDATQFTMEPADGEGHCDYRRSCTYVTTATGLMSGWYEATDLNGLVAGARACPTNSPNGVYGCYESYSRAAFYVPKVSDVSPPSVRMVAVGRGLTTKAIAAGEDPYGKPISLTWDFGDGSTATGTFGKVVTHTYQAPGNFQVTAKVKTSDGRYASDSAEAGIVPPKPILQAVGRIGTTTTGAAAATLQGWPAGSKSILWSFTDGCPPASMTNAQAEGGLFGSGYTAMKSDGTVGLNLTYLPTDANAFVIESFGYVDYDGTLVRTTRFSDCLQSLTPLYQTTGEVAAGATEIPADSGSVPIGHVVALDITSSAGGNPDLSEFKTVTGHGSLIVSALARAHATGSYLIDTGAPLPAYVVPPPPTDPKLPTLPESAPSPPTKVTGKALGKGKLKVTFKPGDANGESVDTFSVTCTPKGKGKVVAKDTTKTSITLKKLVKGKKYTCTVRAQNAFGYGGFSKPSKAVKVT